MVQIQAAVFVHAPVDSVFRLLETPERLREFIPNLLEVTADRPHGSFEWVYRMVGVRFVGIAEVTESVRFQRRVYKTHGGIESVIVWVLQPEENGTIVSVSAEYRTPALLIHKLSEDFITDANQRDLETVLANLKTRAEPQVESAR